MPYRLFVIDHVIHPMTGEVLFAKGDPLGEKEFAKIASVGILFVSTMTVLPVQEECGDAEVADIIERLYP